MSSGSVSLKSAEKHESHIVKIALKKKSLRLWEFPLWLSSLGTSRCHRCGCKKKEKRSYLSLRHHQHQEFFYFPTTVGPGTQDRERMSNNKHDYKKQRREKKASSKSRICQSLISRNMLLKVKDA